MRSASAAEATPLSATAGRPARQPRRKRRESFRHHFQRLQITAVDSNQNQLLMFPRSARTMSRVAMCRARGRQGGRHFQISLVERFQQHEHAVLGRNVQQLHDSRARQHAQDHQDSARTGGARFQYLVGIDQEILAHCRHAERRQYGRGLAQMLERSVETRGLGQNRHGRRAAPGIGGDAPQPVLALIAQLAGGRRTQFEFRDDVEAHAREAQAVRWAVPGVRAAPRRAGIHDEGLAPRAPRSNGPCRPRNRSWVSAPQTPAIAVATAFARPLSRAARAVSIPI